MFADTSSLASLLPTSSHVAPVQDAGTEDKKPGERKIEAKNNRGFHD